MTLVAEQTVHGFADIAWDDAALPETFWQAIKITPAGCWEPVNPKRELKYVETVVSRLLRVQWRDVYSATQTCGNALCCAPSHVCVVLRNELSNRSVVTP